jgi:hypothetical protein
MQATMKLNIVNKETMNVLNRAMPNKDNYFERVCVKIGLLIKDSLLGNAFALVTLYQLHDEILNLSAFFDDEIDKFEGQIEKKKNFSLNKVNFIAKYDHDMPCGNTLSYALYELVEGFDRLISTLKLLHLSELFESRSSFYQIKQRYQKKMNKLLSQIIKTPSAKRHQVSVLDVILDPWAYYETIPINELRIAFTKPYAPELDPHTQENLRVLNQEVITVSKEQSL